MIPAQITSYADYVGRVPEGTGKTALCAICKESFLKEDQVVIHGDAPVDRPLDPFHTTCLKQWYAKVKPDPSTGAPCALCGRAIAVLPELAPPPESLWARIRRVAALPSHIQVPLAVAAGLKGLVVGGVVWASIHGVNWMRLGSEEADRYSVLSTDHDAAAINAFSLGYTTFLCGLSWVQIGTEVARELEMYER